MEVALPADRRDRESVPSLWLLFGTRMTKTACEVLEVERLNYLITTNNPLLSFVAEDAEQRCETVACRGTLARQRGGEKSENGATHTINNERYPYLEKRVAERTRRFYELVVRTRSKCFKKHNEP